MEYTVIFEEKITLSPKDLNEIDENNTIDNKILAYLRDKLEKKCSQHGYVLPGSLKLLSRSMGILENGRYTGSIIFYVQAQGRVYNPANGTIITGKVLKKNNMGLYVIYKDAIRILVPRDLHVGNEDYEQLEVGDTIECEIRKSRFQIYDPFILSVANYKSRSAAEPMNNLIGVQNAITAE